MEETLVYLLVVVAGGVLAAVLAILLNCHRRGWLATAISPLGREKEAFDRQRP